MYCYLSINLNDLYKKLKIIDNKKETHLIKLVILIKMSFINKNIKNWAIIFVK